jgi:hypothetical protein
LRHVHSVLEVIMSCHVHRPHVTSQALLLLGSLPR